MVYVILETKKKLSLGSVPSISGKEAWELLCFFRTSQWKQVIYKHKVKITRIF